MLPVTSLGSAPSCDHFSHHGEWSKILATKILAKVANRLKEKLKFEKLCFDNRTNLISSTSGSITCLSLFPSRCSESWLTAAKWSVENVPLGVLALRVIRHEVSSPSRFFGFWRLNFFFCGDRFSIKVRQKVTFWNKWAWSAAWPLFHFWCHHL